MREKTEKSGRPGFSREDATWLSRHVEISNYLTLWKRVHRPRTALY